MIHICHICAAETGPMPTNICGDCDITLKTILPAEDRHEINVAMHELEEHEGTRI